MKLTERTIEVNAGLHFSTSDVTSYEKVDEHTYVLNVSSAGVTETETIAFNLLPDELRDLSNLSNSRSRDFVWIYDDVRDMNNTVSLILSTLERYEILISLFAFEHNRYHPLSTFRAMLSPRPQLVASRLRCAIAEPRCIPSLKWT